MQRRLNRKTLSWFFLCAFMALFFLHCAKIEPKGPDYIITDFIYPTTQQNLLPAPSSGSLSFKIKNKGKENGQAPVNVKLYISPFQYYDNNAILIPSNLTLNALNAGDSSSTQTMNYTIPNGATISSYFLLKIETSDKETDTFNNISSSSKIGITGGAILRTVLVPNSPGSNYSIGAFETQYFKFSTQINNAYQIYWDDYSEGTLFQSATAANIKVSSATADNLTTFFSLVDNGYNTPETVFSAAGADINIDATTTGTGGIYSMRIVDIGSPPNLKITITASYNAGQNSLQINYTLTNSSTIAITGANFTIGFWANTPASPPATVTDKFINLTNQSIAPGGTFSNFVTLNAPVQVDRLAYAYVDLANNIVENNENDNLSNAINW